MPFLHITRPVYFAWVVMIQMVLLPRFGMQADIDYDPTDDWEDDNETELSVLGYDAFFKALFKVPLHCPLKLLCLGFFESLKP